MLTVTHGFFFFVEEFPDGVLESDDDEDEDDEVSWRLLTPIGKLSGYSESLSCLEELVRKRSFFSLLHFSRFCRLAGVQLQGFQLVLLGVECGGCFLCPSWPRTQGLSPWSLITLGSGLNFLISWLLVSKRVEATASDPLLGSAVSEHLFCGLCSGCIPGPAGVWAGS